MGIARDDHGHGIGARHNFTVACGNLFAVLPRGKFSWKYGSFGKLYENECSSSAKVHGQGFEVEHLRAQMIYHISIVTTT